MDSVTVSRPVVRFNGRDTINAVKVSRQALQFVKDFTDLQPRIDSSDLQQHLDELDDHLERMRAEARTDVAYENARDWFGNVHHLRKEH